MRQLLRHLRGKVIVIWDRGNMHRGDPIRQLLRDYPRLSIEELPPYAPDLNPVEQVLSRDTKFDRGIATPSLIGPVHASLIIGVSHPRPGPARG